MPCCEQPQSKARSTPWPQGLRHQQLGAGFGSPGCSKQGQAHSSAVPTRKGAPWLRCALGRGQTASQL